MKQEENKNNNINKENEPSLSEKISDGIEDAIDSVDEIFHPGDFQNDIPATHKTDSGRRIISKVQTNRNINKRLFGGKRYKIFAIILLILLVIGGLVALIEYLI